MDILQVNHLSKRFGSPANGFLAVDDVSFSLQEGEILGFLGPNGAGKTTTIQMLMGVLKPTSGKVSYFGRDLETKREEILEEVNFSSTYTNLPWRLTVRENLNFISYLYQIKDRKKRIAELVELFRLGKLLNIQLSDLSAGQLTRVNLAKAFINFPRVLLLDEPTASLDPEVAQYIREFLLHQRKKYRVSMLFTSHNMAEIEEICDRVIFINHGRIVADDTPDKLASRIGVVHIELLVASGKEKLKKLCENGKLTCSIGEKFITVDVEERSIPHFLKNLNDLGIVYEEISIEKPTLEDFFLQVAKRRLS